MPDVVSLGLSGERNAMKWTSKAKEMRCPSVCPVSATLLPEARAVGGMRYPSVCPVSATAGATDGVEIEDAESLGLSGERNSRYRRHRKLSDAVSLGLSSERNTSTSLSRPAVDAVSLGLSGERNRLRDVAAGRTDAVSLGLSGERNSE